MSALKAGNFGRLRWSDDSNIGDKKNFTTWGMLIVVVLIFFDCYLESGTVPFLNCICVRTTGLFNKKRELFKQLPDQLSSRSQSSSLLTSHYFQGTAIPQNPWS